MMKCTGGIEEFGVFQGSKKRKFVKNLRSNWVDIFFCLNIK